MFFLNSVFRRFQAPICYLVPISGGCILGLGRDQGSVVTGTISGIVEHENQS